MASVSARRLKRETTIAFGGLITPDVSMSDLSNGTSQKGEQMDVCFSDDVPTAFGSPNHGLIIEDEGYATQAAERRRRSVTPSFRASQPPSPQLNGMDSTKADTGLELVGQRVKILVDAINDLRQFGLDHVVQLPELVLVGDQSAGKSSLMSALTEVHLPRSQGICTKCPANIKTSPAETWSCRVSLQQYFKYCPPGFGKIIDSRSVTRKNPFPPWVEQKLEVKSFKTIYNKTELEDVMKWAQIALLNHDHDHKLFIPGLGNRAQNSNFTNEFETTEAGFSPNVIAVEISGPGLPALSFYDLPGIFRVAPDPKNQYLAKVIENLAVKYIQHPNALIIWALTMKTDPANSSTGKVIADCGAKPRCIGVLTMPDSLQDRHVEFENILRNQAHVVGHSYFVTKQPGPNSKLHGLDYHARAREEEQHFFGTDELWTGDWIQFRDRCGTIAIQKYLSQEFARQISESIPSITRKIEAQVQQVDEQLRSLPELPAVDIRNVVQKHLSQFSTDVRRLMDGDCASMGANFQSEWTKLSDHFRDLILHIRPMITVSDDSDKVIPDIIEIVDDEEDRDEGQASPVNTKKYSSPHTATSRKRQRVDDTPIPFHVSAAQNHSGRVQTPPRNPTAFEGNSRLATAPRVVNPPPKPFEGTPFEEYIDFGKKFISIGGIRTIIAQSTRTGIPGLVNDKVYDELCMLSVDPWDRPMDKFMEHTARMLGDQLEAILLRNLGQYQQTDLFKTSRNLLFEYLARHEMEQRSALKDLYNLERYKLFTVNRASIEDHKAKELENLQTARRYTRARCFVEKQIAMGMKKKISTDLPVSEQKKELKKRIDEVKPEQLGNDPFDLELRVASYVRGYYLTAALRFVDSVCLSVHGKFFKNIRDQIFYYLETELGITAEGGEEVCKNLMEENDEVRIRRAELRREMDRLTGFSERLAKLRREVATESGLD